MLRENERQCLLTVSFNKTTSTPRRHSKKYNTCKKHKKHIMWRGVGTIKGKRRACGSDSSEEGKTCKNSYIGNFNWEHAYDPANIRNYARDPQKFQTLQITTLGIWPNCSVLWLVVTIPCLLSTSINEVNAVPPTVHSSTGAAKFPTWRTFEK